LPKHQQQNSEPSLKLVQHPELNFPPHKSNNNKKIHFNKKNNNSIDVAMTIYSISTHTPNQKDTTNDQENLVTACSNYSRNIHSLGSKNKNNINNKNHQINQINKNLVQCPI